MTSAIEVHVKAEVDGPVIIEMRHGGVSMVVTCPQPLAEHAVEIEKLMVHAPDAMLSGLEALRLEGEAVG